MWFSCTCFSVSARMEREGEGGEHCNFSPQNHLSLLFLLPSFSGHSPRSITSQSVLLFLAQSPEERKRRRGRRRIGRGIKLHPTKEDVHLLKIPFLDNSISKSFNFARTVSNIKLINFLSTGHAFRYPLPLIHTHICCPFQRSLERKYTIYYFTHAWLFALSTFSSTDFHNKMFRRFVSIFRVEEKRARK